MAGTPDVTSDFESKSELDFRNRLIAKFAISRSKRFWGSGFEVIPKSALYPSGDRVETVYAEVKRRLGEELQPGDLGQFIQEWVSLEAGLLDRARRVTERNVSVREAIAALARRGLISHEVSSELDALRQVRNTAVHKPDDVTPATLAKSIRRIQELRKRLPPDVA